MATSIAPERSDAKVEYIPHFPLLFKRLLAIYEVGANDVEEKEEFIAAGTTSSVLSIVIRDMLGSAVANLVAEDLAEIEERLAKNSTAKNNDARNEIIVDIRALRRLAGQLD